ncbi:hypothetical protein LF864_12955 [Enterococcus faecalis]|uniref:hypothetical protein n=1 Tax=Enterococcus faecalis TaxID=1351 RepID=UPI001A95E569|nr:hypothetical protein [Enterococcus faecalis]MBO1135742.1 hypothetical protein [Enterococcus faecalis]MCA6712116.1 hypothetical protein [Enterococcus faecalis]MCA6725612.1 hypothetical protein [Enterococcus faecalis]MCA6731122.1 hypothetical protein [Enterococcus faecalis]MCA6751853.1 hypothetical protein [Enterococcus faecalis]
MKKFIPVILLGILFVFSACGNGNKPDKDTQAVIDTVVKERTEVSNASDEVEEGKREPYKYTEKDFSFLIYRDKEANNYIMKVWVPYEDKPSHLEYYYSYNENKELNDTDYKSDFQEWKSSGNYELVYKSGKFKE